MTEAPGAGNGDTQESPDPDAPYVLATGMTKRFGSILALQDASLEVRGGEVMALVGENGAGKSTLVKILCGLHRPDAGTVHVAGEAVDISTPHRAEAAGIAVVQQELSLVPAMSVAENLYLGDAKAPPLRSHRQLVARARPYLERVGLDLDPRVDVERLSVAEQQLVEIARLLARQARVLILDEPTAALADAEISRVHAVVRTLRAEGRCIVYVTHRLGEVLELGDRVTVLRDGTSQPPFAVAGTTVDAIVERMLGTRLDHLYPARSSTPAAAVLEVDGVVTAGVAAPVTMSVRAGEIVGIAGQLGSGATQLLRAVAGVQPVTAGQIRVRGDVVTLRRVRHAIRAGIAYCSSDRKLDGLFLIRPVIENLSAPGLRSVTPGGWLRAARERRLVTELMRRFRIDQARGRSEAGALSGGNQQKVALGKWMAAEPRILVVDEPTRGVDVGARAEIYAHLRRLADDGLAIVFASSDIQEVLGLADTVVTFYRGRVVRTAAAVATDAAAVLRDVTHPAGEAA